MKKNQWFIAGIGILLITVLYFFGNTVPPAKKSTAIRQQAEAEINIDTILYHEKELLNDEQVTWLGTLEKSVIRGDVKSQQMDVLHQLPYLLRLTPCLL